MLTGYVRCSECLHSPQLLQIAITVTKVISTEGYFLKQTKESKSSRVEAVRHPWSERGIVFACFIIVDDIMLTKTNRFIGKDFLRKGNLCKTNFV